MLTTQRTAVTGKTCRIPIVQPPTGLVKITCIGLYVTIITF